MSISISIWGTCSSRDAFVFGRKFDREGLAEFQVDCYLETIDPLAALTKSVALTEFRADDPRYDDALKGMPNYHKRIVQIQINKEAFERLGRVHSDWLMLDCGPLRVDLAAYEIRRGGFQTETAYLEHHYVKQLKRLENLGVIPAPDRIVHLDEISDEDFAARMEDFVQRILGMYDEEHIIINEVRPVKYYLGSERMGAFDVKEILQFRKNIDRGFAFLKKRLPKAHVIEFPRGVLGSADHQWGLNPFHYVLEYYDYVYEALDLITAGGCTREEEEARLGELKLRCEDLLMAKYESVFAATVGKACDWYYVSAIPTARIGIKNCGAASNKVDILEMSDKAAVLSEPPWFCDEGGTGSVVESSAGRLELSLRCEGSGELLIALRGKDAWDEHGERVPRWVEYTSLAINGEQLLDDPVDVWHDKPYEVRRSVVDGQAVKVSLSWRAQGQNLSASSEAWNAQCGKLAAENMTLAAQVQKQEAEIERLRSSTTWKTGRAVTWLPRKIKHAAKKGKIKK